MNGSQRPEPLTASTSVLAGAIRTLERSYQRASHEIETGVHDDVEAQDLAWWRLAYSEYRRAMRGY